MPSLPPAPDVDYYLRNTQCRLIVLRLIPRRFLPVLLIPAESDDSVYILIEVGLRSGNNKAIEQQYVSYISK